MNSIDYTQSVNRSSPDRTIALCLWISQGQFIICANIKSNKQTACLSEFMVDDDFNALWVYLESLSKVFVFMRFDSKIHV